MVSESLFMVIFCILDIVFKCLVFSMSYSLFQNFFLKQGKKSQILFFFEIPTRHTFVD